MSDDALSVYRAERDRRGARDAAAMTAARDELARRDAERAEARRVMRVRCDVASGCGKYFEYIRGHGRPPVRCPDCRTKPKTKAVARMGERTTPRTIPEPPAVPRVPLPVDAVPTTTAAALPDGVSITPTQFTMALRLRLAALDTERKAVEQLLALHECSA